MIFDDYKKNLLTKDEQQFVLSCFSQYEADQQHLLSEFEFNNINDTLKNSLIETGSKLSQNQVFSFAPCATDIIDKLFKQYVDDDTLVITTNSEHPSVVENLKNCKNVLRLINKTTLQLASTAIDLSKYKRIFVYMIAISVGDGGFVSNSVFDLLQKKLTGIPSVFVLDAVQELFMLPRDYSIFDYVIGTAHAIVPKYNCGIVISKEKPYCKNQKNIAMKFSKLLQIVLKRKQYLKSFSIQLHEEFKSLIDKFQLSSNYCSSHLYSIGDIKGTLLPIIPESQRLFKTIRSDRIVKNVIFRGCWSIFDPVGDDIHIDKDNQFFNMLSTTKEFLKNLKK